MIRFLQTPGPVKKIILSGILLVFCGAMVITLIPGGLGSDLMGQPTRGVIAKVAGQDITTQEVQERAKAMVQQQFPQGGAMTSQLLPLFLPRAVEQLIAGKAIVAEANRLGLKATDADLRDELEHGRYGVTLFPGGKFIGQEAYEGLLSQNNLTVEVFERDVKNDILQQKLVTLVTGSAAVSPAEIRQQFQKSNTKVKFEYAVLSPVDIRKGLHPTDQELKAFYERNKASYNNSIPEKRKIEYLFLDKNKVLGQIQVTLEDVKAYYDQHQDQYRIPEEVKVSHILIKTPSPAADGKVDEKAVAEARNQADDVLKQLKAGAKFEDLAKKYSDDPGSGKQGGDLGWSGRGRTVPEFERAAFALPIGQLSDLVKSSYGFHIMRVSDKHQAHVKTIDEVKDQIEPLIRPNKVSKLIDNAGNALLTQARAQGIEKAAAAQGLTPITTDFVSRTD